MSLKIERIYRVSQKRNLFDLENLQDGFKVFVLLGGYSVLPNNSFNDNFDVPITIITDLS